MDNHSALPQGTPVAVATSIATSAVAQVAYHTVDPHDIALYITIISGTFSIIISIGTFIAIASHFFTNKK
jgi:hypothetical protein